MLRKTNNVDHLDIFQLPVKKGEQVRGPWRVTYSQSHILHSKCSKNEEACATAPCDFCLYDKTLELPQLPDMVFPTNILSVQHDCGAKIEFTALDGLKRVAGGKTNIQLPIAESWKESRLGWIRRLSEKLKPFDWTFETDYMGTCTGFDIEETDDRISYNELIRREYISIYHDLTLFEDEVHDHGVASLSVKIRVMDQSLFILLRYFLRIDRSIVKINDTRIFHRTPEPFLLREYTSRESEISKLDVPPSMLVDPSLIAPHLPLKYSSYHKLSFASKSEEGTADP